MHIYDILKRPIVTEKTSLDVDFANKYTFEVDLTANKFQVKDAVETAFDVVVEDVNILVMPVKTARRGKRIAIRKRKWKKAIVTLAAGNSIQLFEGV
ncbi:MAG: 50S ribosomal protein L23 [Caldilineaceae bacterium]|nr:50S ribosomal protein L23 [Caldilineaceae bacterium]